MKEEIVMEKQKKSDKESARVTGRTQWDIISEITKNLPFLLPTLFIIFGVIFGYYKFQQLSLERERAVREATLQANQQNQGQIESAQNALRDTYDQMVKRSGEQIKNARSLLQLQEDMRMNTERIREEADKEMRRAAQARQEAEAAKQEAGNLKLEAKAAKKQVRLLNDQKIALTAEISKMEVEISELEIQKERLVQATDKLIRVVKRKAPSKESEAVVKSAENAKYSIGLYGLGMSKTECTRRATQLSGAPD